MLPSEQVVGFIDQLRLNGFAVGPAETMDALAFLKDENGPAARLGLKSMLSQDRATWDKFDELFEAYWFDRGVKTMTPAASGQSARQRAALKPPEPWNTILPPGASLAADDAEDASGQTNQNIMASGRDVLSRTDMRQIVAARDVAAVEELAEKLAHALRDRLSRRQKPAAHGARIDIRRTIRRNLSKGGDPFDLVYRKRPERPARLVVFLDVSGSMQPYGRLFLAFLRGLMGPWLKTDAYLFHTRLVRITEALAERDHNRAMERLTLMSQGYGGGTKIGHCLAVFNDQYAKQALKDRSVVIIVSDGYDTGEPALLARQLARLKRRARRLIWLNPLAGWDNYAPVARGMVAAWPHIDLFRPANTLASLAALEPEFARL